MDQVEALHVEAEAPSNAPELINTNSSGSSILADEGSQDQNEEAVDSGQNAGTEQSSSAQAEVNPSPPNGTQVDTERNKYILTKEMAQNAARMGSEAGEGPVVVTWANYHYLDFVLNWVHHIELTGCKSFLVGAMDNELLEVLVGKSVPAFGMASGLTLDDFGWGSSTFHKMGREKISLLQTFTKWGIDVIISDVDTVWLRNPVPYMAKYPEADILVSSDHLSATTTDGGLELYPEAGSAANIGIMMFRPNSSSFVDAWVNALDSDPNYWDQNAFNDLFRMGMTLSVDRQDRLFKVYNETLLLGILPVSLFCSGHTYFVQNMPDKVGVEPYVVHATFQYSGTPGKRNRFREALLWEDDDSYFQHQNGFISAHHKISERLLDAAANVTWNFDLESVVPHFNLVHQQMTTIRTLFALGTALDRVIIMPKIYCGMDRWWAPHNGNIPGAQGPEAPFQCPLDHILDLEHLDNDYPEDSHGPKVEWREFSFLENPKAKEVKARSLTIVTCNEHSTLCDDGSGPATITGDIIKLRAQRTDKEIQTALSGIIDAFDLLQFENPVKLWKGFESHDDEDKFVTRYTPVASLWCCVNPPKDGQPGHIWYDMWNDKIPHSDRFKRWIDSAWKPIIGP